MAIFRRRALNAVNRTTPIDGPLWLLRPQLLRRFRANLTQLGATLLPGRSARLVPTQEWRQQDPTECGAVSLGIVLRHFGRHVPLSELRRASGVSRDGSDAANLVRAAQLFGLEAKGFKKGLETLQSVRLPAILFWNFDHFLVLDGIEKGRFWLNDPATGRRCVELDEFDRCYTGVVLTLQPGEAFVPSPSPPAAAAQLRRRLSQERGLLLALLVSVAAAALLLTLLPLRLFNPWPPNLPLLVTLLLAALVLYPLAQGQARQLQRRTSRALQKQLVSLPSWVVQQFFSADLSGRLRLVPQLGAFVGQQAWLSLPLLVAALLWGVLLLPGHTALGLLVLAGLGAVALVSQWSERLERSRDAQQRQAAQRPAAILHGGLQDPETLKASALERDLWLRWSGLDAQATLERQRLAYSRDLQGWIPQLLAWSLPLLTMVVGLVAQLEPVPLVALALGLAVVQQRGQRLLHQWHNARAALEGLAAVEEQPADPLLLEREPGQVVRASGPVRVELEAVSFGYVPVLPPLIEGLSLTVEPGQRIAIVGGSASGKSTLARLMAGLLQPTAGTVRLNGHALMDWPRQQRLQAIAMVQQGLPLLSCSVRANLTFWDAAISQAELEEACATAEILDRIQALPQGFDTPLHQAGSQLSGGELQRLQIAQALLQKPALMILDEATAALDAACEAKVERAFRQIACTQIVVAHRLSTIRDADEILVLEQGRLVQRGLHIDMVRELGSPYQQLLALDDS